MIPKELLPPLPFSSTISLVIQHFKTIHHLIYNVQSVSPFCPTEGRKAMDPKEELFEQYVDKKKRN